MLKTNRLPLFFTATSLFWFALYAYMPYVAPYAEEMQADMRLIGLIAGSYGFTQMIIRFPLGIFSDRLRKRKVFIMAGLFFAAVSGAVVFVFPSPIALLAARSLAGVAASSWVIFTILGAAYNGPNDTVKTIGLLNACNSFGRMIALLLGGIIAERMGFSHAFLLSAIAGFAGLIISMGIVEKKPETKEPPTLAALLEVAKNSQLLCASILAVLVQYISFATTFGFVPLVATELNATNFQLGMLGVIATLPGLIISPFAGKLVKKLGIQLSLTISFTLMVIACLAMPVCQAVWQLFALQILNNIGMTAAFTILMGLCIQNILPERRAAAMGFFQAVYGLGMFLGPFIMGWVSHSFGLASAFVLTGGIGILGVIASVVFVKKGYLA